MVNVNKERLIEQFFQLVQIDSETKHEAEIASYLIKTFTNLGLTVQEDAAQEQTEHKANNLICTLKGNLKNAPSIFFSSHMDTVTPGKNIKPALKNGYIVSDGTTILGADDKAGIATMIELIHLLKENKHIAYGDLQFIITVGEESGLTGAKVIDKSLITATSGYVLDSDGAVGNLVIQAPYQAKLYATISGKTAHAGVAPEKGVSAITVAAKSIAKMNLGRIDKETTANISYFKGGKKEETNIVTEYVEIEGEVRSLQRDKLEKVKSNMTSAFNLTAKKFDAKVEVAFEEAYPGYALDPTHNIVKTAQIAANNLKLETNTVQSGGGSDANIFNDIGLPTANLSVGYEFIHTTDERIHTDELVRLSQLLVEIIKETYIHFL